MAVTDDGPDGKSPIGTVPIGRMATTEDVANVAEFLAGESSSFLPGEDLLMTGRSSN
ncbi:hypothetical protein ACIGXM_27645 [Kitasatospora sp. NPDC052896]|uniref:hypothetical protein n=1 Tax=Kitasatospora sp. NPDC052896 TaxID=3364061 RepID=UPI0037C61FBF